MTLYILKYVLIHPEILILFITLFYLLLYLIIDFLYFHVNFG